MSFESGPLRKKLPELHNEPQVERAVQKKKESGEKVSNTPEARIGVYLDRLDTILTNPDEKKRERNLMLLKPFLHDEFVIPEQSFPESYFELQKRVYRERGQAVEEFTDAQKRQMIEVIRQDQTKSLDNWTEYLTSDDAGYPTWFKYLAFRNITKLSQFDKERGHFKKRSKDTVAPYPDIYHEALAIVADKLEALAGADIAKLKAQDELRAQAQDEDIERADDEAALPFKSFEEFERYAKGKFPDLYAHAIQDTLSASIEGRENIRGEWVAYEKGDMEGADRLHRSLQGKGTGWCTAGKSTAEKQLQEGDFHVYYSYKENTDAIPSIPRIAVRMSGDQLAEVRGVLPRQGVEPILQNIVDEKLETYGDKANAFKKKSDDMKRMSLLDEKVKQGDQPTAEELRFLYEVDSTIEGFGYDEDPRIAELRESRDIAKDLKTIFDTDTETEALEKLFESPKRIIHSRISSMIIANIDSFAQADNQFIFNKIAVSSGYVAAVNIARFKSIDRTAAAKTLIEGGYGTEVLNLFDDYPEKDRTEIFDSFSKKVGITQGLRWLSTIQDYIDVRAYLKGLLPDDIDSIQSAVPKLIHAEIERIPNQYHSFVAQRLLDTGSGHLVAYDPRKYHGLDEQSFVDIMAEQGNGKYVLANFQNFKPTTDIEKVLESELENEQGRETVAKYIDKLPNVNSRLLADRFIDSGSGYVIIKHIDKFAFLDPQEAMLRVLQNESVASKHDEVKYLLEAIAEHPAVNADRVVQEIMTKFDVGTLFSQLDAPYNQKAIHGRLGFETARRIIENGFTYRFSAVLASFTQESRNSIAELLLRSKNGNVVVDAMDEFPDLDHDAFFKMLIANNPQGKAENYYAAQGVIDRFTNLHLGTAELLLLRGDARTVGEHLEKFSGLTEHIAQKLIGNGYRDQVTQNLGSFIGLLPGTLESLKV